MTNSFDTSSIPETNAYWDALFGRVTDSLRAERSSLVWLGADRSAWLAAACIFAAALGLGVFARQRATAERAPALQMSLLPADAIGRMIVGGQDPPAIASLAATSTRTGGGTP